MKKRKMHDSTSRRAAPSSPKSSITNEPPQSFIGEMVNLFHGGELGLFEMKAREAIRLWPENSLGWKALGNLFLRQRRHEDALENYSKCIRLAPDDAQAHHNLGSAFLGLRRFAEAEACFRQSLALKADYAQAYNNLGITLLELGRLEEAIICYQQALTLKPDFAEAHNNLGNARKELGQSEEAEADYRQAVELRPDFPEAHSNLGNVLLELGRPGEAEASYRQALACNPDHVQAHSGLGDILLKRGKLSEAISSYRQCLALDPMWVKAHDGLNKALGHLVPPWHVPMMNDAPRNDAYLTVLRDTVTPDTHVLEIGTGSGLLSMMAASLGARRVTTCEAVAEIAETARAIVADNGFASQVTVINKMSTRLKIGEDMDDQADLLVSEILSSEFLGEGVLSSIEDGKRRLLKPGGRIIPARGSIQFALFGGPDIEKNIRVDTVCGFDLSRFNTIVSRKQYVSRNDLQIELLTDDFSAFFFDFSNTDRFPASDRKSIDVPVRRAGRCCGIIQWLRLEMDDTVVFENHPAMKNPASSWQHCVYVLPAAMDVAPGQVAVITAAHNRNTPWFFLEGIR
jgi:tetratricopeptide (TPR) repeat protein